MKKKCKECGRIINLSEKNAQKARENGKKGGRPIDPESARQKRMVKND